MIDMPAISITIGDTQVSVQGGPEDDLKDISRALHAELEYLEEHHTSLVVEVDPSSQINDIDE
jgi:hypothetical protein